LIILLASSFAISGIAALATGRRLPCPCFGEASHGYLGWRQVLALPLWGVGAWAAWNPRIGSLQERLAAFVIGMGIFVTVRAVVVDEWSESVLEWLSEAGFDVRDLEETRVLVRASDDPNPLGVTITALAVEVQNGVLLGAMTVPSVRRFYNMIPVPFNLTPEL